MDHLDKKIIKMLKENSRESHKSIGEKIHLTGQAVGVRIKNLEESGVIQGYTIKEKISRVQLITVYMNSTNFEQFENFIKQSDKVEEFHKISGDGCYFIKTSFSEEELDPFLTKLANYARYKINTSIKTIR
ncbi:Lrp/AsnC family transcriptional regulator [Enterococcus sp. LJL99]